MTIRRPMRLRFIDGEDDFESGGGAIMSEPPEGLSDLGGGSDEEPEGSTREQEPDDGLGDLFGTTPDGEQQPEGEPSTEPTKNPAVKALLDKVRETLPLGLHSLILDETLVPELTKMQQGFDSQIRQFDPYRDFVKNGVTPEQMAAALGMAQYIGENPGEALKEIAGVAQQRGLNPAELLGIQIAQAVADGAGGTPATPGAPAADDPLAALLAGLDAEADPQLAAVLAIVQQQQQELTQFRQQGEQTQQTLQQREEKERQRQEHAEIASAVDKVKQAFVARNLHFNDRAVLAYANDYVNSLPEAQRGSLDAEQVIKEGAKAWLKDVNAAAGATQRRAPRLGGGSSATTPTAPAPAKPKTLAERLEKFKGSAEAIIHGDVA